MRRILWTTALTAAAAFAVQPAAAQRGASPRGTPNALPFVNGALELTLEQAVELAIENNLDVEIRRFEPLIAEQDLRGAWGAYDPEAFGEGGLVHDERPTGFALEDLSGPQVIDTTKTDGTFGVRGQVPVAGALYSLGFDGSRAETNSSLNVLSPENDSSFLASVQIPLLRNLVWNPSWTQVRVSELGLEASRDGFATELMDLVRRTEDAYWELIAAQDSTHVAVKSVETAEALLELTRAQYDVGVVSRVEVVQAEAGLANRQFNLIAARARERNVQDALVDVVLGPYLGPRSAFRVEPKDRIADISVRSVDVEVATEKAFKLRPELEVAQTEIDRRGVELKFASNQRLPELNLVGSYGFNGLSGRNNPDCNFGGIPCSPSASTGSFWDSTSNFFSDNANEKYAVRGVLTIPLGNVSARSEHVKAQLELRRAQTRLRRLQQDIISQVRQAARDLEASVEGIEAAERGRVAAAEQLRAERVRLEHGESTPFDVLLREEDLVRAESQKIAAQQVYNNSVTGLERAQGTILSRHHIVVEEAAALR
jgi:outer membrane protein